MTSIVKIVSGGQTGVDQGALNAALQSGIKCGGWCPPNRESNRGVIPEIYPLEETPSAVSPQRPDVKRSQRTEWNVFCSDATLILRPLGYSNPDPGTDWTEECTRRYQRLCGKFDPFDPYSVEQVSGWLNDNAIRWLNVAGPAEEDVRGIEEQTRRFLLQVFSRLRIPALSQEQGTH